MPNNGKRIINLELMSPAYQLEPGTYREMNLHPASWAVAGLLAECGHFELFKAICFAGRRNDKLKVQLTHLAQKVKGVKLTPYQLDWACKYIQVIAPKLMDEPWFEEQVEANRAKLERKD